MEQWSSLVALLTVHTETSVVTQHRCSFAVLALHHMSANDLPCLSFRV